MTGPARLIPVLIGAILLCTTPALADKTHCKNGRALSGECATPRAAERAEQRALLWTHQGFSDVQPPMADLPAQEPALRSRQDATNYVVERGVKPNPAPPPATLPYIRVIR